MWKLQPAEPGTAITLFAGKEYVVGRKNCDILLSSDQSISRVHARLTVTDQAVTLKDESKYGTFVNDNRLDSGSTNTLYAGDRLVFGVFQSKFKLELGSVVVCSSCVDNEGKAALSQDLKSVGGRLVNSWSQECTHLVMPSVKVTIKTICALLCCRPIVKPEFFTALSKAVQQRESLPKVESFRPEMDEPSLNKDKVDLGPRPERKTLFKGKTFVFLNTKQMKRLNQVISFGGGSSQLLEEGSLPRAILESKSSCVVDVIIGSSQALVPPAAKKWADSVGQILHRNGLRFITESEIGLAAIYLDHDTYCNPCSHLDPESTRVKPAIPGGTLSQNAAVDETVLPAASLNVMAYVTNTETSQSMSRMDMCGATAVGETPEKRPASPLRSTRTSTVPRKPTAATEPPSSSSVESSVRTSDVRQENKKAEAAKKSEECVKFTGPVNGSSTHKKSPQKQSSLTNYFQTVNKKRQRKDSEDSALSEAKLPRQEVEEETRRETKKANPASSLQNTNAPRLSSHPAQNQRVSTLHSNYSLGLGPGIGMTSGSVGGSHAQTCDPGHSKKRKEPEEDPAAPEDLDVSLEELESIMSEDMDEPVQPAASKKQRLHRGEASTARKGEGPTFSNQATVAKQRNLFNKCGNSEYEQGSGKSTRKSQVSNRTQDLEQEESSSRESCEDLNVKEEEVSFVVETKVQNGLTKHSEAPAVKQEIKGSESDPDLPRKLLQVHFKSLTVSAPCRTGSEPLQNSSLNGKNFKRFRKAPVPGLQGLPRIIGGSDLVAHNRSKISELEEWLRDAAEEEKQQAVEEALGDDLFRYNPKPSKRR